ncbi:MAG: hypothetical protein EHM41_11515 [Chloroflexi bacterium]|nr:MAG: hypothetical protein EHM41_11515 [Chloroflexota bacterium]
MMVRKLFSVVLLLIISVSIMSCTSFEVGVERTPTPDTAAIGTLAALMVQGTRFAAQATERAIPMTPTPTTGQVRGQVCYPSERIPPMMVYFLNDSTGDLVDLQTGANQSRYQVDLPAGKYIAFAWVPDYEVGGLFSEAVVCGLFETCNDHSPSLFTVQPGDSINNIDLCDWAFPASSLPIPPGLELP